MSTDSETTKPAGLLGVKCTAVPAVVSGIVQAGGGSPESPVGVDQPLSHVT